MQFSAICLVAVVVGVFEAIGSGAVAYAAEGETLVDRVVGTVDGHPVLYSDVQQKVTKGPLVVVSDYPAEESSPVFERALQDALNYQLVMEKAKDLDIDVRDDEVESEITSFLATRGLNKDGLMEHLKQEGMTYEDYRRDFKDQMILRRFQGRVIGPLVKVTDKDVETYYLKKAGSDTDLVELVLRQILIAVPTGASEDVFEAKQKLAREVHQRLTGGMPFVDAVVVYSDESTARDKKGAMAPVRAKDLATPIRIEVENLEPGQFSMPVKTAMGFHIFLLEERRFSGGSEFLRMKGQLEAELRGQELADQTRRWLIEQRQRSKVEIIPQ
jgi:peptidyl-prolyl cis-trans isomerase SurA